MTDTHFLEALSQGSERGTEGQDTMNSGQEPEGSVRGRVFPDPPVPPWEYDPETPPEGLGWMLGYGADYWRYFGTWFMELSKEEQASFTWKYPEPEVWRGFYDSLMGEAG